MRTFIREFISEKLDDIGSFILHKLPLSRFNMNTEYIAYKTGLSVKYQDEVLLFYAHLCNIAYSQFMKTDEGLKLDLLGVSRFSLDSFDFENEELNNWIKVMDFNLENRTVFITLTGESLHCDYYTYCSLIYDLLVKYAKNENKIKDSYFDMDSFWWDSDRLYITMELVDVDKDREIDYRIAVLYRSSLRNVDFTIKCTNTRGTYFVNIDRIDEYVISNLEELVNKSKKVVLKLNTYTLERLIQEDFIYKSNVYLFMQSCNYEYLLRELQAVGKYLGKKKKLSLYLGYNDYAVKVNKKLEKEIYHKYKIKIKRGPLFGKAGVSDNADMF